MWRDESVVFDMIKACRLVLQFRGDLDEHGFVEDVKTQSAPDEVDA